MVFFLLLLNFGISWLNAWSVGKMWAETKAEGGFSHFVTWCTAIMSASGFTWCYTIILALLAGSIQHHGHVLLAPKYVQGTIELGYLVVILPIIGSGLGITISSVRDFNRNRTLANGGEAGYNVFAQVYNTIEMVRVIPGIFKDLGKLSSDDDDYGWVLVIVAAAVIGGFLTTMAIVKNSAESQRIKVRYQLEGTKAL